MEPISITCPRCAGEAHVQFYGPCDACRDALRASMGTGPAELPVETERYTPKMNVTPNAVALKDD